MTDEHSPATDRDPNATQPILILRGSVRWITLCVMALLFAYLSLIALGQIKMSRPTSGFGEGLFAIVFLALIVYVLVKARKVDFTKPIMEIGPDGISSQKLSKLIPWSMIERVDIADAWHAEFIYLTVRKDADPEILGHLRKRPPLERTVAIPHRWVSGFSSREVKDIVNRYFERSRQS
ncbi:hypothetical protein J2J97_22045 (plasmid) [Rhizobium bangladeshense]|nr:hypothetical protein [Rhizobium bangladeshense]MBX4901070.1 hypothetical protein [Rhizobium bangladeshense]MBX4915779.1 hypothetical protein [Rhizobium bangladeshense]MBY3614063.1 hypothetical protein [Rhizobium bangladeshense]QSY97006.1 hypothetical protein J2J97_22045 [Rhizobium bangladeshense]